MNLLIIGEAVARLTRDRPDFLDKLAELPWRSMVGMRNRIAHGYFDLDMRVIWRTVRTDAPELLRHLRTICGAAGESSDGAAY